ncbi:MAG: hypothetical protein QM715_19720 [Nibricoccus sp.]
MIKERIDTRILGAVRWVDAVTLAPIPYPLVATGAQLRFTRNLSGLCVITHADGLEKYTPTFKLTDLLPADVVTTGSLGRSGQVEDPSGNYLPTKFTLSLPRDPSPALVGPNNDQRPPNSLFSPFEIGLLPSPTSRVAPGFAQVRVLILDNASNPIRNALARVMATADDALLGCGLSDQRGEALVAIPGLKHFAPGDTEDEVVSVVTEARLEIILPPNTEPIVDWTALRDATVAAGNTDPELLHLKPGASYSRHYPFTT